MRIVFNVMGVGLGNNGGSHSIVKSANILQDLGHRVLIVDTGASKYTWGEVKVPHVKIKNINDIYADVLIGTGAGSIEHTNNSKIRKKYLWFRGWEVWNTPEDNLIKILKESQTIKLVNSIGLQKKLNNYGIKSFIVRPGHDFDEIFPLDIRNQNTKIIIGGLYNEGKKRSKKRTDWIFNCYNILKAKYDIELMMFGSDGTPIQYVDKYFKNPDIKLKNTIYNKIDIWLATSELEGLHITPAEAMLTECAIVGNNSELSGTEDYLIDNETGMVSENNFKNFLACIEILIKHKTIRKEFGKAGREKILNMGDRKINMLKFLEFLEDN
jgi:glycosyltransferase involved in cell wall biosynthesis